MAIHTQKAALGAVFIVFCSLAGAQAEPSFELDPVTVTASRISESSSESPPAMSVVTRADIDARGATTVADALRVAPGLALSDRGAAGSQAAVSLRGSTANQVLVLVDGVRVNDALTGLVDISAIPLESVERIEVMRGGGSSLYGGDAVGGVVNIITKKAAAPLRIAFENSSYIPERRLAIAGVKVEKAPTALSLVDAQKASLSWAPALGGSTLRFAAGAARAANAFTFANASGERREMQNASLLAANASAGWTLQAAGGSLSLDAKGAYSRKGVPGMEGAWTLFAREDDAEAGFVARYATERFLSDLLSLDASVRLDWASIGYEDPEHKANDGHHRVSTAGLEATQRAYAADGLTLVYGASLDAARAASDTLSASERLSSGAFLEALLQLGPLSARPSLRYDYYSDFFSNDPLGPIGAGLGLAYKPSADESLKLNLSRSYRVPTFEDLHWPSQAGTSGNPGLQPETAYEANLGYDLRRNGISYVATAYLRYAKDVILWQPGADGVWRPSNYGAALYPGLEQELSATFGEGWSVSASYAYLHSLALTGGLSWSDDLRLPMTPVHRLSSTLSREAGPFSWSATAQYASLRYLKLANSAYLPAYFTLDAMARWRASNRSSAYLALDNLFDEQYSIVDGYPMPGTRLRVGVELSL